MFNLGVNTNNECGKTSKEILQNIKKAGFTDVMVAAKSGDLEQTINQAKELGLNIPYVHLSNTDNLWCKGETHDEDMLNLKHQIEICGKCNIPIVVLHATSGQANRLALPPNEAGLNSIKELLKVAKANKVKIALENLDKPNFKHFEYVMDNINSPYLGFCYDVGHHQLYNPNVDLLKKYGNKILAIHLHDNLMDWQYGFDWTRDLHRLPFDGKIDYNKICKKLAATKYKNTIMLELHKHSCGEPRLYDQISNIEFLLEAYKRAQKIEGLVNQFKKQK